MTTSLTFDIHAKDGNARTGAIGLPRGTIRTPAFMPVGTAATVKAMFPQDVHALGADIVLGNTYHLMLRPSAERIASLGGFAQVHELAMADPHRFRWLSSHVTLKAAQAR